MMRYRAVLTDPTKREYQKAEAAKKGKGDIQPADEQLMGNSFMEVEQWAERKLEGAGQGSFYRLYETTETMLKFKHKPAPKPEEKADGTAA